MVGASNVSVTPWSCRLLKKGSSAERAMQHHGAAVHRPGEARVLGADVIERHGDGNAIGRANAHVDRGDIGRPESARGGDSITPFGRPVVPLV